MINNDTVVSIVWLFIFMLPPLIVYFIKKHSKKRQTSNKITNIYLLIFTAALIISGLLYSLYGNLYISLSVFFGFGVIALLILIRMQNNEKKKRNI